MRRVLWLGWVVVVPGCLEVAGYSMMLDLKANRGELVFHDIRSAPLAWEDPAPIEEDLAELVAEFVDGDGLGSDYKALGILAWTLDEKTLVAHGDHLDGVVRFRFSGPEALRLDSYDQGHPTRFCPEPGLRITATNAAIRERNGCLSWKPGTTVLRFEGREPVSAASTSLLDAWRK